MVRYVFLKLHLAAVRQTRGPNADAGRWMDQGPVAASA